MRILFTNTGPWGTGSATVVDTLSLELMRQGHEVKIFFPDCHFESMDMDKYYGNPRWLSRRSQSKLALAILDTLSLRDDHHMMQRARAHEVASQFSWKSVVETRLEHYNRLCATGQGAESSR